MYLSTSRILFPDKPSAPRNLHMTEQYKDYITVAWDTPLEDGGAAVTGYVVERRDANRSTWSRIGEVGKDTLSYKAKKLLEGNEYYFRVAAENAVGTGSFITTDDALKAKLPFGKSCYTIWVLE